ncbi:MAG: hypothetical protein QUU85_08970, partial [Candidatus Eisenbacteria bacterium]|nr:hypothetical protein [Candidatus Eisenbacteria bacterium]
GGYATGITVHGNRAYVPSAGGAFAILSLDVPGAPALLGNWWEAGSTNDVRLQGGIAYTVDGRYGLHVVDLHTPQSPEILAHLPIPDRPRALAVAGDFAYVAADSAGVFAVDISDPAAPEIAGHLAQYAVDVECDGRYLFTVARNQGMRVIDALDPHHPELVAICPVPGWPTSVSVAGGLACVTNGTEVYVVDVSDPREPWIRGILDPPEHTHHVTCDRAWAYVCAGNNAVLVIDLAQPENPIQVADLRFDGNTWGTTLFGSRLYLPTNGLQVIDVSDPRHPQVIGSSPIGTGYGVAVEGAVAVTAAGSFLTSFVLDAASSVEEPISPGSPAEPEWPPSWSSCLL